jgi:raffinose/stachyose/melibiose transport system permease protein
LDRIKRKSYSYALLLPGFTLYMVFFILPTIGGLILSFANTSGFDLSSFRFLGFENYQDIFTDPDLNIAIINSFKFTIVTTVFKLAIGLLLAILLNKELKTRNALRSVYFVPAVINSIAVGLIFTSAMHPTTGIINKILNAVGLGCLAQSWLTDTNLAIYSVSAIEIWKWSGFCMVILLSGMQAISKEYYEAAAIDGVSSFQKFRYITFPLLLPAINNCLILNIVGGFKAFDIIQGTTQGGPGTSTQVFGTLVYKCFGSSRLGEGSAASILLAIIVMAIALPTYRAIAKKEIES